MNEEQPKILQKRSGKPVEIRDFQKEALGVIRFSMIISTQSQRLEGKYFEDEETG